MNKAEEFVQNLSKKSFLSMWGLANPQGKEKGKELCDFLVICGGDIIIFSVKEIEFYGEDDSGVATKRWYREAINASVKQIYGAERLIGRLNRILTKEGEGWLPLPSATDRRIFRIAVAIGSKRRLPIYSSDFGKGFVHIFDEISLGVVMQELDTIVDFVDYLKAKEDFWAKRSIISGGEEDLLAVYLYNGRSFSRGSDNTNVFVVEKGSWGKLLTMPEYINKKKADEISYGWDNLIEKFCEDFYDSHLETDCSLSEIEETLRGMARESRFNRRFLAKHFLDLVTNDKSQKVKSRKLQSPSGVVYVFSIYNRGEDRQYRKADLGNRCFVARGVTPNCNTVIGIATEAYEGKPGFSLDAVYLYKPNWLEEDRLDCEKMQQELGYFLTPKVTAVREEEYPK